ncbi:hypothetical protein V4F39_11230 [Aquincola sp. MAHUQ-54]|uniref:Uncharacterized protein n=1 Tax=Aquincola agrisoli TaxID=3119538 RepID=A0AAW9QAM6_9BURK
MNAKSRFDGLVRRGTQVTAVAVGTVVGVAGVLLLWVSLMASLVVGALALLGWWGWARLRGRRPMGDFSLFRHRQASGDPEGGFSRPGTAAWRLRQGEVVDVEVREVPAPPPSPR